MISQTTLDTRLLLCCAAFLAILVAVPAVGQQHNQGSDQSGTAFTDLSITGIDPLDEGEFELEHLERADDFRLLVADGRDSNQLTTHGWDFLDNESAEPGITVRRTDLWSESNSGPGYSHDMPPEFETGFGEVLEAEFSGPGSGHHDAGDICVEFN